MLNKELDWNGWWYLIVEVRFDILLDFTTHNIRWAMTNNIRGIIILVRISRWNRFIGVINSIRRMLYLILSKFVIIRVSNRLGIIIFNRLKSLYIDIGW